MAKIIQGTNKKAIPYIPPLPLPMQQKGFPFVHRIVFYKIQKTDRIVFCKIHFVSS
jgi:hypothetical protein